MKKQDTEESVTQAIEDTPPAAGEMESPAAAKDSLDSNSPKESEPQTPQTDTPPQSDEAGSDGNVFIHSSILFSNLQLNKDSGPNQTRSVCARVWHRGFFGAGPHVLEEFNVPDKSEVKY